MAKTNPRTGIVDHSGVSNRPKSNLFSNRKPRSPSAPQTVSSNEVVVNIDLTQQLSILNQLLAAVRSLADKIQQPAPVQVATQFPTHQETVLYASELSSPPVSMDESVVDVGIGEQEEIKKGKGSAALAKKETKKDKALVSAKDKLKALRKRKGR